MKIVCQHLFSNLVVLMKTFPSIHGFLQQDGCVWIYHATKAVAQKFEQSTESTGIFKNCYCTLQYGMRSNESTNRLLVSTCNKSTPHGSSGQTFLGYRDVDLTIHSPENFQIDGSKTNP